MTGRGFSSIAPRARILGLLLASSAGCPASGPPTQLETSETGEGSTAETTQGGDPADCIAETGLCFTVTNFPEIKYPIAARGGDFAPGDMTG